MSTSKKLREQRFKLVTDAQKIYQDAEKTGTAVTKEQREQFNTMMADAETLKVDIDNIEKADAVEAELRKVSNEPAAAAAITADPTKNVETKEQRAEKYRLAFRDFLENGTSERVSSRGAVDRGFSKESRDLLEAIKAERRDTDASAQSAGSQTISYTAGAAGGYFVPAGFVYDVDVATKFYAPLMDGKAFRVLETATGAVLPYPTNNDTSQVAAVLAENTQAVENPLTMGQVTFGAYKYTSQVVRVSLELLQDSAFDIEAFLKDQFAIRFGRGYEAAFTIGAGGGSAPTGILTALNTLDLTEVIANGANPNSGNAGDTGANSIGTQDLVNLEHSVDPTYRYGASFMLNDQTVREIKNLLDKFGRPIWVPGLAVQAPDTILGYKYTINQSMPKIGPNAPTVLFGAMQKFIIRKVREMSVLRLVERYADYGQIGFVAFSRVDSNLVDAGTHPINQLIQHS
jgi:HK97 family phage major capsid protein